jgi:hypothetical protein
MPSWCIGLSAGCRCGCSFGYGGAYYSWQNAEKRHPTSDPVGTANVLAEYVAR